VSGKRPISFLAFYLIWAKLRRWAVPEVHKRACHWLEHRGDLAVFRAHRGFSKSTLLAVYNAWRYYDNPQYRILHQSEADPTAYKTSRDTQNVLRTHPLTRGMFQGGGVQEWWVHGSNDPRNASMYARGILSNVTSARADECQNDDIEVPRNIQTSEAREKLRYRLGEQTHILVPGGRQLYVGTPHTHESLYDEQASLGADCLTIRMFEHEFRIEDAKATRYALPFVPEYVFAGIGKAARLLTEGRDYRMAGNAIQFAAVPGGLIDLYAGIAWADRFDRAELIKRRRRTRTINEWDSQYQLHSKPIHDVRLDPARLIMYEVEPIWRTQNRVLTMWLGKMQIVSARAYWDCATGRIGGDASVLSVVLDDARGNHYWHRGVALTGDYAEFADTQNTHISGGQVMQAVAIIKALRLGRVVVETNGVGSFVPKLLGRALKQESVRCGVGDSPAKGNKNERILAGLEGPLLSGVMWAHRSVVEGPAAAQMRQWNAKIADQPDDYLDSAAGALLEAPVRIGQSGGKPPPPKDEDWRPSAGVFEVTVEA
jgi:hypothetical protein